MKKVLVISSTSIALSTIVCLFMSAQASLPTEVDSVSSIRSPLTTRDIDRTLQQRDLKYTKNRYCLALNIYHEARSESKLGQEAVALVAMNRRDSERYPNTVCGVVYQSKVDSNGNPIKNKCQFSWFCDGKSDYTENVSKWIEALEVAAYVYNGYGNIRDITGGAIMYHGDYVDPYWKSDYTKTSRIDSHIFYK